MGIRVDSSLPVPSDDKSHGGGTMKEENKSDDRESDTKTIFVRDRRGKWSQGSDLIEQLAAP